MAPKGLGGLSGDLEGGRKHRAALFLEQADNSSSFFAGSQAATKLLAVFVAVEFTNLVAGDLLSHFVSLQLLCCDE